VIGFIWDLEFGDWNLTLSTFSFPFDEFFDHHFGLVIRNLNQRMLHCISGDGQERTSDSSGPGDLTASDGIDRHPATVRGVLYGESQFEV
jgi:hypothetical protein